MTTPSIAETKDLALLDFVQGLRRDDDRGALGLLRGALADSAQRQMRAWRILARFGGIPTDDPHKAEVVRTVAGLLALSHLHHKESKSFGHACRQLLGEEERKSLYKPEQTGPIARRVQHLLAANRDEVCERARRLGRRLDAEGAALDFIRLYSDLIYWSDRVKARWAADFWEATGEGVITKPEAKQ